MILHIVAASSLTRRSSRRMVHRRVMFQVYRGERVWLSRIIRPVETFAYKLIGVATSRTG